MAWLDAQAPASLCLTAITVAELSSGVAVLPPGRRRNRPTQVVATQVLSLFEGRILPFDVMAAHAFAPMHAGAQGAGNATGIADSAIATIAAPHGFALATRIASDLMGSGIELIDSWAPAT